MSSGGPQTLEPTSPFNPETEINGLKFELLNENFENLNVVRNDNSKDVKV